MNVHEHDIGAEARNFGNRFFGGGTVKNATKPRGAINPLAKQLSHDGIVFNDCNGGHNTAGRRGRGRWRTTVVPVPGAELISQWPPRCSRRPRRLDRPLPAKPCCGSKPPPLSLMEICI